MSTVRRMRPSWVQPWKRSAIYTMRSTQFAPSPDLHCVWSSRRVEASLPCPSWLSGHCLCWNEDMLSPHRLGFLIVLRVKPSCPRDKVVC